MLSDKTPENNDHINISLQPACVEELPYQTLRAIVGDIDMDRLRDAFIALDTDGDGYVSMDHLAEAVISALGNDRFALYYPYLVSIFSIADKDRDSMLDIREFIESFAEGLGILPQEVLDRCVEKVIIHMSDEEISVLQKSFYRLDSDGDGLLSHNDIVEGLRLAFARKCPSDLNSIDFQSFARYIIYSADTDRDGKLNLSEYISSFQRNQSVFPIEMLEYKPEGVLQSLNDKEKAALKHSLEPLLEMSQCAANAEKNRIMNDKFGDNVLALNNARNEAIEMYTTASELRSLLDVLTRRGMGDILHIQTQGGNEDRLAIIDAILLCAHHHPNWLSDESKKSLVTIMPIVRHICLDEEYKYPDFQREGAKVTHLSTGENMKTDGVEIIEDDCCADTAVNSSSLGVSAEIITSHSAGSNGITHEKISDKFEPNIVYEDVYMEKLGKVFRYLDADHDGFLTAKDVEPYQLEMQYYAGPYIHEDKAMRISASVFTQANTACSGWLSLEEFRNSFISTPTEGSAAVSPVLPMAAVDMLERRIVIDLTREEKVRLHRILISVLVCITNKGRDSDSSMYGIQPPDSVAQPNETLGLTVPASKFKEMVRREFSHNLPLAQNICCLLDNNSASVDPYYIARVFNIDILNESTQKMPIPKPTNGFTTSTSTQSMNTVIEGKQSDIGNNALTVSKVSNAHVKDPVPVVTPFEISQLGVCFRQLATQSVCSLKTLKENIIDIFIPKERQGTSKHSEMECWQLFDRVVQHIYKVSKKDKNGMIDLIALSEQFSDPPLYLNLRVDVSPVNVEQVIQLLCNYDLCNNDMREITAGLVEQDRHKDGVVNLSDVYLLIIKIIFSNHPTWSKGKLERVAMVLLNAAHLDSCGHITLKTLIRTLAARYYVVPMKYDDVFSGALSRRLDISDIVKVRNSICTIPQDIPREDIREVLNIAIQHESIVDDYASVNAIVNTILEYIRCHNCSLLELCEKLECSSSTLVFPLMLPIDCSGVCLRKLQVILPTTVLQRITRTLLLLDRKGDGVLARTEVENALFSELKFYFSKNTIDVSQSDKRRNNPLTASVPDVANATYDLVSAISLPNDNNNDNSEYSETIYQVLRLIILSQYECGENLYGKNVSTSRALHFNGFINSLLGIPGTILPVEYLPSITIQFPAPLSSEEVDVFESAMDMIRNARRGIASINDLHYIINNALLDHRRSFSHVIIDTFTTLADGPDGARFDFFEIVSHYELTQSNLVINTKNFSPAAAERVVERVIRKDSIRDLARVFLMIDTKKDYVLDISELHNYLMNDCIKSADDENTAVEKVAARFKELDIDHDDVINFEEFLASFCMSRTPAVSETVISNILNKGILADGQSYTSAGASSSSINTYRDTLRIEPTKPIKKNTDISNHRLVKTRMHSSSHPTLEFSTDTFNDTMFVSSLQNVPLFDSEMQDEFNKYDVYGNGYIDYSEFRDIYLMMENYGVPLTPREVESRFKGVCASRDRVSFEEFCILMLKRKKV